MLNVLPASAIRPAPAHSSPRPSPGRNKVVLFYPPYDGPPLGAPLCLLALAGVLRDAGFRVSIIDACIHKDYLQRIVAESADAVCVGISVLTGPMIRGAISAAKALKTSRPELPVVFGGWHPSLEPAQTVREAYVDVVVRGQGELTMLELAQAFSQGNSVGLIAGIHWKQDGQIIENPERTVAPIGSFAAPAYDLADFDAYEPLNGHRKLAYATSVGCPYACNYCTDMVVYRRRFNAYDADRVVGELVDLVRTYRIDEVALLDSNFPVDVKRALAIARGIVNSGVRFQWTFQASTDFLCRMTQDEVQLLADSGVKVMGFGTESTSQRVLKLMNKRHQRVDEMYETARKAHVSGIKINFNLIFGYPGETEEDRVLTFQTMSDIVELYNNVQFSPNLFTPYPGIPIWPQLRELGVQEPQSLEEWIKLPLSVNALPWLQGEELERLRRMTDYFLLNGQVHRRHDKEPLKTAVLRHLFKRTVSWRVRSSHYGFPWELWASRLSGPLASRRSLVTGQELPDQAAAC